MGFCVTNAIPKPRSAPGRPEALARSGRRNEAPPLKKSRLGFFSTFRFRAGVFGSQPVESHRETAPVPTKTVSGLSFWLSRDPVGEVGFIADYIAYAVPGAGLYTFVRNDVANLIDPLGLSEWRLDLTDHGGPHIQLGDYRWDARTLEPIPHNGITPPRLTPSQMKELAKSGVLDDVLRKIPNSVVKEAGEELFGKAFKDGTKCLSKSAQKQLAKSILRKIPVVLLIFAANDYAEGGVEKAVKNAVIPGDLIEDVLKDSSRRFDEWSDAKVKSLWDQRCKCAGLEPGE